jgi:hypothetical protein
VYAGLRSQQQSYAQYQESTRTRHGVLARKAEFQRYGLSG